MVKKFNSMFIEWLLNYPGRKSCIISIFIGVSFLFNSFSQNLNLEYRNPIFEYLSRENSLPDNSVTCILQDYLGYLWLGTLNGLVRYDGYSIKVFKPDQNDSSSISSGTILVIYEDKNKNLWIGTRNGINKFNRSNDSFKSYKYNPGDTNSINGNRINCIYEDDNGKFWVGTNKGLNLFDGTKGTFSSYYLTDSKLKNSIGINAVIKDPASNDLLVGTNTAGLWRFKTKGKIFSKYKFNTPDVPDKKIGLIQSFCKSRDGIIWMASSNTLSSLDPRKKEYKSYIEFPIINNQYQNTKGAVIEDRFGFIWCGYWALDKGIFCLNPQTGIYHQYKITPAAPDNSDYNRIYSLYEDNSGIIWIGSWLRGLVKWDRRKYKFQVLKNDPANANSISYSRIYNLNYDRKGYVWFATGKALDKFDFRTGKFRHYLKNNDIIKHLIMLIIGNSGNIWFSTLEHNLVRFNPANGSYQSYFNDPEDSLNHDNEEVIYIFQDRFGVLWLGTRFSGLYKYDIKRNKIKHYMHYPNDPESLSANRVNVIFEDSFGTLWIGTDVGGLDKFDGDTEKFTYTCLKTILNIYEDKQKNFWVIDYFSGLNLFDRKKNKIIASYGEKEGIINQTIINILEDDHNNLWLTTQMGLSKFSVQKKTFKNYTTADGLPNNRFHGLGGKDANGNMYFKTEGGIIYFHPDSIKDDPIPPKVVLSRVSLFNKPGEKLNYKGFISELKEITLPYYQNDLRFDYVGLHFSLPAKNKYKYILENFDRNWVDAGTQRNATYTNLDPGKYIFSVKAANKDGIWNETGTSITVIITPPWWETTHAYILYFLIVSGIIFLTWRLQLKRLRLNHEYEMSRFEAEKMHEVDELKSRFFTNISHEFRTPLTLILGPVKQMIERIKDEKTSLDTGKIKNELQVVHKNANSLLKLVNELLDISKLESGNMKLHASPQNIIPLLKVLVLSFSSYAERKRIALKFNNKDDEIIAYIDKEKIEKVITNLLTNAFKFTHEGGEIEATVNSFPNNTLSSPTERHMVGKNGFIEISIRDTGIGISEEKIPKIFDRFYQVNASNTREHEGTGIGLSLTKELIELHKGRIEVESEEGRGTTFKLSIPLGKEHLEPDEICELEEDENLPAPIKSINTHEDENGKTGLELSTDLNPSAFNSEKPILLIVEDNYDVRNYIRNYLESDYKIIEAGDGEDGWIKSIENIPDLIISDVMMPKTDGFELCSKLKVDERTSHIPLILLTAKAAKQDKIEGFETGADDYLVKPFETDELKARIKNLINQRKRIHEHFRKHGIIELEESKISSSNKKFIKKVFDTISENISDPSFNVETLSKLISLSRSVLHKKIVSLTGEPPVELIRRIRLNKAAELIKKKTGNISEIAFDVGYNNPAYFSECFKKQFGVAPSQYK